MNAGLDGSNAGTALRASLLALNNPAKVQAKIMDGLGFSMKDNEGKAKSLSEIVGDLTKSMEGMTEAEKVATLAKLVGTEAVSGFLSLTKAGPAEIEKMSEALRNSAGASEEAAAKMKAGIGGALENLSGAFESLVITIGDQLVPYVQKASVWLADLAEKFTNLSDGTKKFIVVGAAIVGILSAIVAVIGVTMAVVGGITAGIGAFAATMGVATTATGLLSGVFAALTGPIGISVLAIVAAGVAVAALVKHFRDDAIPEVNRFGEGVSASTEKALTSFFKLSDDASQAMADLSINSGIVTEEMKNTLVGKFAAMNAQIVEGMNKRHAEQLASMTKFFADSSVLTDAEEAKILEEQRKKNEAQLTDQQKKEKRINEIIETAYKEKRALTTIEEATINGIKDEMNRTAVKTLSKSQMEQKVIFESMAETADELSARQAAKVVENSAKARDGSVKEAKTQYKDTVAEIIRMRDETGAITKEQADKMIAEAGKSRDTTIKYAEEMHAGVVGEAKKQAKGHVDEVDWETGQIKSKWGVLWTDLKTGWNDYVQYINNTNLKQIGIDVMTGLNDGLASEGKKIRETVTSLADGIAKWTKDALDIHSPSRVMFALGEYTGQGLANGITSTKAHNEAVMKDLGAVIASVAKSNASEIAVINKAASAEQNAIAKKATEDIAAIYANARDNKRKLTATEVRRIAKIEDDADAKIVASKRKHKEEIVKIDQESASERMSAIQKFLDNKNKLEELSLIDEVNIWRKAAASFRDGTQEKIDAQANYRDALAKINTEITSINETYAGKMSAINDKLRADEEALTKTYADTLNSRMSSLMSFAGIFDEFDAKVTKSGDELLANLNSQVDGFKLWQSEITALSGKAIDEGLLAELQAMGPKALPELIALNSLTAEQLAQYSALYKEKAALARTQAEAELVGMKADTAKRITELRATANTELALLQTEWVAKIKGVTQATTDEFKTLTQIGKNAGQNLLNGLASMEGALVAQATAIASAVNAALQSALGGSVSVAGYNTPNTSAGTKTTANKTSGTSSAKSGVTQNITINSNTPLSPAEIARKQKQAAQQLAMEWR